MECSEGWALIVSVLISSKLNPIFMNFVLFETQMEFEWYVSKTKLNLCPCTEVATLGIFECELHASINLAMCVYRTCFIKLVCTRYAVTLRQ